MSGGARDYVLGHAGEELDRLISQSRFYGDLTARLLDRLPLRPGQRVLDVGCGAGDVSFLAARRVGPGGKVIGVDRSAEAIGMAKRRAERAGLENVHFLVGDIAEVVLEEPVDALIGRLVLIYLPDPAAALRRLVDQVKPRGGIAFHEYDMHGGTSHPPCPLYETSGRRIRDTFARAGIDTRLGLRLGPIFTAAGLPAPEMTLEARVEAGPDSPIYEQVSQITRTLLPLMERTGVASAQDVGIETLADRLRDEAVSRNATLVPPPLIGAWTHRA